MDSMLTSKQTGLSLKARLIVAIGLAIAIASSIFVTLQVGAESGTTAITPNNEVQEGWSRTESGGGTLSYVNSSGAMGKGALQFVTPVDESYVRFRKNIENVKLSSITSLSYMTKQVIGNPDTAAVNFRLYIDTNGDKAFDDVLVYEPYYNGSLESQKWQTWNMTQTEGKWWSNEGLPYNSKGGVSAGSYETNFTLSDVVAQYPNAQIDEYGLGTGTTNFPWVVQADAMRVNETTYNFEPVGTSNTPTNKDLCKNDGWKSYVDDSGKSFKNQGQCVSYQARNDTTNR